MGRPLNKHYFNNPHGTTLGLGVANYVITNGGSYTALPTITIDPPSLPGTTAVGVVHMAAVSATVDTSGSGAANADYAPGDLLTVVGGTGTPAVFAVDSVEVRTAGVSNQGTGTWAPGDTFTFSVGWDTAAVITVVTLDGANIDAISYTNKGVLSGPIPTDPVTPDSTSNLGGVQGVSFNLGFGVHAVSLDTAGDLTALAANPVATTTDSATGDGAELNITYEVLAVEVTNAGSGYVDAADADITFAPASTTAATAIPTNAGVNVIRAHAKVVGSTSVLDADIVKQVSDHTYVMTTTDGTSRCSLTTSTNPPPGGAYILAYDANGSEYFVTKITAHRIRVKQKTAGMGGYAFRDGADVRWSFAAATNGVAYLENI